MNNFGSGFSRWFLRFAPKSLGIRISDSFFLKVVATAFHVGHSFLVPPLKGGTRVPSRPTFEIMCLSRPTLSRPS